MKENVKTLLEQTKVGAINIETKEGAKKWQQTLLEMEEKEREKALFNLAEVSRSQQLKKWHTFIWDVLFALFGGMSASFDNGYWAANKYYKRVIGDRREKVRKILERKEEKKND